MIYNGIFSCKTFSWKPESMAHTRDGDRWKRHNWPGRSARLKVPKTLIKSFAADTTLNL